jgi:predicted RNA binding protein YcfA (HicA-like mRNA interferase family)
MTEKICKLKAQLRKVGFVYRPAKGSHTVWYDPLDPENEVTFSGHDGDDAKEYLIKDVRNALKRAKEKRQWNP